MSNQYPKWERGSWKPRTAKEIKEWQIACKLLIMEMEEKEAKRGERMPGPELTLEERREKNTKALTEWVYLVMGRFNRGLISVEETEWLLDRPWLHDDYEEIDDE